MKLVQLLKLAEEFETAVNSYDGPHEAAFDKADFVNKAFNEKKIKEVVSVVSSFIPATMSFDVQQVDTGPDRTGAIYCALAIEIEHSSAEDAKNVAKKIFENLKMSDDFEKLDAQRTDMDDKLLVLVVDFQKSN